MALVEFARFRLLRNPSKTALVSRLVASLVPAGALLLGGCADKDATALVVAVSSEAPPPKEIDTLHIEVTRGGSSEFFGEYDLRPGKDQLPGTLTLQNDTDKEPSDPVTVTVTALLGPQSRVIRTATLGFVKEKTKLLKLPLRYSCVDFKSACGPTQSCIGGECKESFILADGLPDYQDDLVFGSKTGGPSGPNGCFDDGPSACLAAPRQVDRTALAFSGASGCVLDLASLTAEVADAGAMSGGTTGSAKGGGISTGGGTGSAAGGSDQHPPIDGIDAAVDPRPQAARPLAESTSGGDPTVSASNLNFAVHWTASSDPARLVVLDRDPEEGWDFADTAKKQVRFGDGICSAIQSGAITRLVVSSACAPKELTQPLCVEPGSEPIDAGGSDAAEEVGPLADGAAPDATAEDAGSGAKDGSSATLDAAVAVDSGTRVDASAMVEAGAAGDGGISTCIGSDSVVCDAGTGLFDASSPPIDAGGKDASSGLTDAGSSFPDGSVSLDAGTAVDADADSGSVLADCPELDQRAPALLAAAAAEASTTVGGTTGLTDSVQQFVDAVIGFQSTSILVRESLLQNCANIALALDPADTWSVDTDLDQQARDACTAAAQRVAASLAGTSGLLVGASGGHCVLDETTQTSCEFGCRADAAACTEADVSVRCSNADAFGGLCAGACGTSGTCELAPDVSQTACNGECSDLCYGTCSGTCYVPDGNGGATATFDTCPGGYCLGGTCQGSCSGDCGKLTTDTACDQVARPCKGSCSTGFTSTFCEGPLDDPSACTYKDATCTRFCAITSELAPNCHDVRVSAVVAEQGTSSAQQAAIAALGSYLGGNLILERQEPFFTRAAQQLLSVSDLLSMSQANFSPHDQACVSTGSAFLAPAYDSLIYNFDTLFQADAAIQQAQPATTVPASPPAR